MSGKIEVGDWVVQYKPYPCCGHYPPAFGLPFLVVKIDVYGLVSTCNICGFRQDGSEICLGGVNGNPDMFLEMELCKRIDPPASESSTETTREREKVA